MELAGLSIFETRDIRYQISDGEIDVENNLEMERTHDFKRLAVWQRARRLVTSVYKLTADYPKQEKFGLCNQTRRAAVSIPSNITEGCGSNTINQMVHFLTIARGSAFELETQLIIASDLRFANEVSTQSIVSELSQIQRMINGLITRIKRNSKN